MTRLTPRRIIPAGTALVAVTYGLARYAYGLFLPHIRDSLALDTAAVGMIAGLSYIGYLVATLFGTGLAARFGPRLPMVAGGIAAALGMALIGLSDSVWTLSFGVLIAGASPGLAYPPLAELIMQTITPDAREKTYTWINSGTSFGVVLAAPIAVLAGMQWRMAWLVFAALALVVMLWNARLLPRGAERAAPAKARKRALFSADLMRPAAYPHFASAFAFGLCCSVYWTFAVDLLVTDGGWSETGAAIFWSVVGIAGIAGSFTGHMVRAWGLRVCYVCGLAVLSLAIALHPFAISMPVLALVSAMVFGAGFIAMTALYGISSIHLFNDNPSLGFGVTFFLISLGQFVGPPVSGHMIQWLGMSDVFALFGATTLVLVLFAPRGYIRSMTV